MSRTPWIDTDEAEGEETPFGRSRPLVVSLHFLRTSLRRRLAVCVLAPLVGLLGAVGFLVAFPAPHAATASMVLTADPQQQSSTPGMATDVNLLRTQTLTSRVIDQLGLTMTPDEFVGTVSVEQTGTELMSLTLTAPTDAEAVRRLDALTQLYLQFRADQVTYQSQVVIRGLQDRITQLGDQSATLTAEIDKLSRTTTSSSKLNEDISARAAIQSRIETLEQNLEDTTLTNAAIVASSRVLDPPTPQPGRALKNTALVLATGVIGLTALGWGGILFFAIMSTHLRRRADVAAAVGADVRTSVGAVNPLPAVVGWLPGTSSIGRRRSGERQVLAASIISELVQPGGRPTLAVAGIDNGDELVSVVAEAARELALAGSAVTLIDLTGRERHGLHEVALPADTTGSVSVLRPRGVPALTQHTDDLLRAGLWDDGAAGQLELTEVTLVVAELQPATGAGHLAAWTDRAVLVVTAGRTSVERIRTVSDQVRAAGLDLPFAALLRTEAADDSSGTLPTPQPAASESDEFLDALATRLAGAS